MPVTGASPAASRRLPRRLADHSRPRTLFVASTGGHLMQLTRLAPRMDVLGDPLWVTFDTPQSRSLLAGKDVEFVRFTAPRDVSNVTRNLPTARRLLNDHSVAEVVSTGSAVALSFLPLASLGGVPCHYVESAARSEGPSMTGRVLSALPRVRLYTQYQQWASPEWHLAGSVFDEYFAHTRASPPDPDTLTVVVTLGTLGYRFDRLVESVRRLARPGWQIHWQIGSNDYGRLPGRVYGMVENTQFQQLCASADVIISHSGVGSALTALEAGRLPILCARQKRHGEHVDDHQKYVSAELAQRSLAVNADAGDLNEQHLAHAISTTVHRTPELARLRLVR